MRERPFVCVRIFFSILNEQKSEKKRKKSVLSYAGEWALRGAANISIISNIRRI